MNYGIGEVGEEGRGGGGWSKESFSLSVSYVGSSAGIFIFFYYIFSPQIPIAISCFLFIIHMYKYMYNTYEYVCMYNIIKYIRPWRWNPASTNLCTIQYSTRQYFTTTFLGKTTLESRFCFETGQKSSMY